MNKIQKVSAARVVMIVGHPAAGIADIQTLLCRSGMTLPSAGVQYGMDAADISSYLVRRAGRALDFSQADVQLQPAPIWQSLALDMLLANGDKSFVGWADAQAIHMLDYWHETDPAFRFVLAYDSPSNVLARAFASKKIDEESINKFKQCWNIYNTAMLSFYSRNSGRCLLVNSTEAYSDKTSFIKNFNARMDMELKSSDLDFCSETPDVKLCQVASSLVEDHDWQSVYENLQSIADIPEVRTGSFSIRSWNSCVESDKRLIDALAHTESLKNNLIRCEMLMEDSRNSENHLKIEKNKFKEQVELIGNENRSLLEKNEKINNQIDEIRLENEDLKEYQKKINGENSVFRKFLQIGEEKILEHKEKEILYVEKFDGLKSENRLLLLQLHEAQEELECKQIEIEKVDAAIATLKKDIDALRLDLSSRDKSILEYEELRLSYLQDIDRERDVNVSLNSRLHQLQDDLLLKSTENTGLEKCNEVLESKVNELQKRIADLKNTEETKRLLLLQLHEVQEALEASHDAHALLTTAHETSKAKVTEWEKRVLDSEACLVKVKNEQSDLLLIIKRHEEKLSELLIYSAALEEDVERGKMKDNDFKSQMAAVQRKLQGLEVELIKRDRYIENQNLQKNKLFLQIGDNGEANRLLLLQLHQAQEEIERGHFEYLFLQSSLNASKDECLKLSEKLEDRENFIKLQESINKDNKENSTIEDSPASELGKLGNSNLAMVSNSSLKSAGDSADGFDELSKEYFRIKDLEEENKLLLLSLHKVQEKLERFCFEDKNVFDGKIINSKNEENFKDRVLVATLEYGAAERVKKQLSYRLGNVILTKKRSFGEFIGIPYAILKQVREYKEEKIANSSKKLLPIEKYADAYKAEEVRQHLSYRLGKAILDNYGNPIGWVKFPFVAYKEIRSFRLRQKDSQRKTQS